MPAATGHSAATTGATTGATASGAAPPPRQLPRRASPARNATPTALATPRAAESAITSTITSAITRANVAPASAPSPAPARAPAAAPPRLTATSGYHRATFLKGFVYAWNGLVYAIRTQRNARIHAAIATAAILMGIWLRISPVEFAMVFVAITAVFIAEMFNTVAEACVDMITNTYHPLARIAKDVAAGAVLLNAMLSVVIGLLVFVPHLWPLAVHLVGPLFTHGHGR